VVVSRLFGPAATAPHGDVRRFGARPFVPNGHFYSPIPSLDEIRRDEGRLFSEPPDTLPGLDLGTERQLAFLERCRTYYADIPFPVDKQPGRRYFFENPAYSYSDAIFLHCMIRDARPRRIIEVGSGYSSCATLDTIDHLTLAPVDCTFIEPYPDLLHSLLEPGDEQRIRIVASRVQDVDLGEFARLGANDILFIDSTHVAKTGSDVTHLFAEVLPRIASGVLVHFHDIFYPFEYPREWVFEGRAWNEAYMLRSFLQFNSAYEIVCFNTYLEHRFESFFAEHMPLCLANRGGSIWLRRT
jgi:predicted O-methyltransferase YrrM